MRFQQLSYRWLSDIAFLPPFSYTTRRTTSLMWAGGMLVTESTLAAHVHILRSSTSGRELIPDRNKKGAKMRFQHLSYRWLSDIAFLPPFSWVHEQTPRSSTRTTGQKWVSGFASRFCTSRQWVHMSHELPFLSLLGFFGTRTALPCALVCSRSLSLVRVGARVRAAWPPQHTQPGIEQQAGISLLCGSRSVDWWCWVDLKKTPPKPAQKTKQTRTNPHLTVAALSFAVSWRTPVVARTKDQFLLC